MPDFEEGVLDLYDDLNERMRAMEERPAPDWARGVEYLIDKYITIKNIMKFAGLIATIYATYFAAAAVNGPLT